VTRQARRLAAALLVAATAALAGTATTSATPGEIQAARANAEAVLAEIQAIDAQVELAVEAYNKANYELAALNDAIAVNQRHLEIARKALSTAQDNLADRIVALYTSDQQDALEVILGAANLDDLLDRVDTVRRISNQDVRIIKAVRDARNEVQRREKELERDQARQEQVVAERASQQAAVEAQLADRQGLYASIKDQIADLEAEERARQAQLAAEAEQRQQDQERIAAAAESAGVSVSDTTVISEPSGIGVAPPSAHGGSVVDVALSFLGVPYVWGGASPSGFDCSGLVVYAFAQVGISLPHYTGALWNMGVPVSSGELQPGDLVFFNGLGHVGIYIGGGQMVHAPHTGDVVKISDISSGYYASSYVGARRVG
jgi:cell wall-associated NlpC family hydrolase